MEILTPLRLVQRVSRKINPTTFVSAQGTWVELSTDGSVAPITADTPATITKLLFGSASSSQYESHDVKVGRITTVESQGIRVQVGSEGYTGSPTQGHLLAASDKTGYIGKLFSTSETPNGESGDYEVVAICEEVGTDFIVYRTISPVIATMSAIESASESPSESSSVSPSESPSLSPSASESPSESPSESASESPSASPSA